MWLAKPPQFVREIVWAFSIDDVGMMLPRPSFWRGSTKVSRWGHAKFGTGAMGKSNLNDSWKVNAWVAGHLHKLIENRDDEPCGYLSETSLLQVVVWGVQRTPAQRFLIVTYAMALWAPTLNAKMCSVCLCVPDLMILILYPSSALCIPRLRRDDGGSHPFLVQRLVRPSC